MQLEWSNFAQESLIAIEEYIAADNPIAAKKITDRISASTKILLTYPYLGRIGRVLSTRELVVSKTKYIVSYRIRANKIQILDIIHSSRQWPDTF